MVTKTDGQLIKGELIAVKQNSLLLLSPEGADVSVYIKDISIIKIVKKSKVLIGAGIGVLIGAGGGAFLGLASPWYSTTGKNIAPAGWGIFFGIVGLIAGTTYGILAGTDKKIQIEGKSDAKIKEVLEKLRHQARMKNAQ